MRAGWRMNSGRDSKRVMRGPEEAMTGEGGGNEDGSLVCSGNMGNGRGRSESNYYYDQLLFEGSKAQPIADGGGTKERRDGPIVSLLMSEAIIRTPQTTQLTPWLGFHTH